MNDENTSQYIQNLPDCSDIFTQNISLIEARP